MRITIFIAIVQAILWLGHYLVYKSFVKFFNITDAYTINTARVIFFLLSIAFLVGTLIAARWYGPIARASYITGAVWMGTLYWLFWASIFAWIIFAVAKIISPNSNISVVPIILLISALLISAYGVWNSYQTKVRNVTIRLENLPENWKGKKIVLVADTHLGHIRNANFAKKVANLVAEQKPEAVFIPGDFYDGTVIDFIEVAKPFGAIPSKYGTIFAAGNHEEFRPKNMYFEGLRAGGVKVLDNEMVNLDGLQIIGVGYSDTINPENQKAIISRLNLNSNLPSILVKHVPSHIKLAEEQNISLQLSGHTHLGQVYPLSYITKKIYKGFHYGLKSSGKTQVYTTSGAGTWGPPQRVGTNSEIIVITLE
jgi:uncharacterized protein